VDLWDCQGALVLGNEEEDEGIWHWNSVTLGSWIRCIQNFHWPSLCRISMMPYSAPDIEVYQHIQTSKLRFCNPFSLFSFRFPYDPSIPYISTGKPTKVSYNSFLLIQNPIRCFILSFVRILRLKVLRVQANPGPLPLSSGERVDASHNHESMTPRDEFNNMCFIHTYDFDPVQSRSRDRVDIPELSRD